MLGFSCHMTIVYNHILRPAVSQIPGYIFLQRKEMDCSGAGVKVTEDIETTKSLKIKELILLFTGRQPKDAYQIHDLKKIIEKFLRPYLDGGVQQNTGGTVPVESDVPVLEIPTDQQYLDFEKQLVSSNNKLESETSTNAELKDTLAQFVELKQALDEKVAEVQQEKDFNLYLQTKLDYVTHTNNENMKFYQPIMKENKALRSIHLTE